ncbi:hypothetical protein BGW36DRAFT_367029 [Talaromyces proteolyticus]|uniref:Uncharacterized protein n=1 Tax=Talaromyces proteolyticus TaxID=1131652 RepID=A0AAD4L514_9EURO|nr:uncharacterized protein BGW36DRAFT_367029 [Talaromyces proteolyticus]KAH8705181.1 hypothetical protein BGW36DRAFT_367029 [Talaromyces proteolyticus]
MAAPTNLSIPVAETRLRPLPADHELKEYEKILRISDEIFAGTHPRLKVPQQFIRKAPSRVLQTPVASVSGDAAGTQQSKTTPPNPSLLRQQALQVASPAQPSPLATHAAGTQSHVAPKLASEIDPIFLTKSDDLVRAEIQLQRRRVENTLREQAERSKVESRQKYAAQEDRPDFDVSEVLNQALEIVKPLPSLDVPGANGTAIPSDSFDENSLYSSRAPDSPSGGDYEPQVPSDRGRQADSQNPVFYATGTTNKTIPPPSYTRTARPTVPIVDIQEDDDYQPPDALHPRRNMYERAVVYSTRQQSISPDMRIVRNHITSPAAPQPSRVSPLAVAKGPSVQQRLQARSTRRDNQERGPTDPSSGPTSPDGVAPQLMSRKRRRVQEPRDESALHTISSPKPRIKPEPVSPPPFHDTQPSSNHGRGQPVYIDIASPQFTPVGDRREVPRESVYEHDRYGSTGRDYDTPVEPSIRATSRLSSRRPARDTQDLRRVASLHYSRNPETLHREYVEPIVRSRSVRASSYAVVERPSHEKPAYYEHMVPGYPRHYAQYEDYPPPSRFREVYVDDDPAPRYIETQPRRIVVDEYGNQYYEMVPASKIRAMPPPPRIARPDDYHERPSIRSASVRAASIVDDGYAGRRYIQEMAPPPSATYRRVTEQPRVVSENQRPYSRPPVEHDPVFRSGSVAVEYASRPPVYVDNDVSRQRLVRTSSVRPPAGRYEELREDSHRVQSVRPGGHEVSTYLPEETRLAREYGDRPVYTSVRPEREGRYYTEEEGGRMIVDGAGDMVRRVPRYQ